MQTIYIQLSSETEVVVSPTNGKLIEMGEVGWWPVSDNNHWTDNQSVLRSTLLYPSCPCPRSAHLFDLSVNRAHPPPTFVWKVGDNDNAWISLMQHKEDSVKKYPDGLCLIHMESICQVCQTCLIAAVCVCAWLA